jgi:hypothetical protein
MKHRGGRYVGYNVERRNKRGRAVAELDQTSWFESSVFVTFVSLLYRDGLGNSPLKM